MLPGEIRTRNPSKQAATDPRFRPRGHWDTETQYSSRFIKEYEIGGACSMLPSRTTRTVA